MAFYSFLGDSNVQEQWDRDSSKSGSPCSQNIFENIIDNNLKSENYKVSCNIEYKVDPDRTFNIEEKNLYVQILTRPYKISRPDRKNSRSRLYSFVVCFKKGIIDG